MVTALYTAEFLGTATHISRATDHGEAVMYEDPLLQEPAFMQCTDRAMALIKQGRHYPVPTSQREVPTSRHQMLWRTVGGKYYFHPPDGVKDAGVGTAFTK